MNIESVKQQIEYLSKAVDVLDKLESTVFNELILLDTEELENQITLLSNKAALGVVKLTRWIEAQENGGC